MIYGYIRVSTDHQTTMNQEFEIKKFCQNEHMAIDGWIRETISGTKAYDQRKLGRLIQGVEKGDLIICTELSRLGRSLFMIMDILNTCMEKECRVWTVKEGYRLGEDIQSKVLAFAFGISAEIERELISERTREALARRKAEGIRLGREQGSRNKRRKLDAWRDEIQELLNRKASKAEIARVCKVSRNTLNSWLEEAVRQGRIGV